MVMLKFRYNDTGGQLYAPNEKLHGANRFKSMEEILKDINV